MNLVLRLMRRLRITGRVVDEITREPVKYADVGTPTIGC